MVRPAVVRPAVVLLPVVVVLSVVVVAGCSRAHRAALTDPTDRAASPAAAPVLPVATGGCGEERPVMPAGPPRQSTYLRAPFPIALAWAPDGRLWFAERRGSIEIADGHAVRTFVTIKTVTAERGGGYSERGLLGLALSPTFAADHLVYAMASTPDYAHTVILRWTDCNGAANDPVTLVTLPAGPDCCHKGGRLAFGPDGKLYATVGDEHSVPPPPGGPQPPTPQDAGDPRGKILRYNPDGTVPTDNPFGPADPVWVGGLRNPFGIAFGPPPTAPTPPAPATAAPATAAPATAAPATGPGGQAFVTSNGPTGDAGSPPTGFDLAQMVSAGTVYQWPYCYGYSHPVSPYRSCHGRPPPQWSSEATTIVPTGATYVDGAGPAPYADHFVFCSDAAGMGVFSAPTASSAATVTPGPAGCHLDVTEGPDHALYFSDETTIYRLAG